FYRQTDMAPYIFPYSVIPETNEYGFSIYGWYVEWWDKWIQGSWLRAYVELPWDHHGWRPSVFGLLTFLVLPAALLWGIRHFQTPAGLLVTSLTGTYLWVLTM